MENETITPLLLKFGAILFNPFPAKFRGQIGWKNGKRIGLTEITPKELSELKTWFIRLSPFLEDYSYRMFTERGLNFPQATPDFRNDYNKRVQEDIINFFHEIIELNKDLITDEKLKGEFYQIIEIERRDYLTNIFKDFCQLNTKEPETQTPDAENYSLISTIKYSLKNFKDKIPDADYTTLITALEQYFLTDKFPSIKKKIQVSKVNKKSFGWL